MTVVALWSAPRARSTALFRSMAERGDLLVAHEPLWNLRAFGDTEVGGRTFRTSQSLLAWLCDDARDLQVFTKETTDHRYEEVLADRRFLRDVRHAFLIRHPEAIVASYHALWPDMRIEEVGLETMSELHAAVGDAGGHDPVVVDSDDLVARPGATMAAFCAAVGLPFLPAALHWEPGHREKWRRSARWHVDVSASSGFVSTGRIYPTTVENSAELARFAAHHLPFYEELRAGRLVVPPG